MNNTDKKSPDLTCGHCGYHAPMSVKAEWSMDHDKWIWTEYKILLCTKCEKVNLLEHFSPGEEHEYPPKIIYPALGIVQFMTTLPENIKDAFYAAVKARWIDKNLYAMALGRVLTLLGLDQGIDSDNFN